MSNSAGSIYINDSKITLSEEKVDEIDYKKRVFDPIIRLLRKNGWKVRRDEDTHKHYRILSKHHRYCRKGDLEGILKLSGRCIEFETYQNIINVSNSNGGKYDFDKLERMPYLMRMQTRLIQNKILACLLNIEPYEVRPTEKACGPNPGQITAIDWIDQRCRNSGHFEKDLGRADWGHDNNRKSADGKLIKHKQIVYFKGYNGKIGRGVAYYDLNSMWWILSGKYDITSISCHDIFVDAPNNMRNFVCERKRRSKLESLLAASTKIMDFKKAEIYKSLLFGESNVYQIWSIKNNAWYRSVCAGYTSDSVDSGKYTKAEVDRYCDGIDTKAVMVS